MIFWTLEDIRLYTISFASLFIHGVEEVEQTLQPFEDDVEFLLTQSFLLRWLIGERWNEEAFDRHKNFLPQSCHDGDHGLRSKRLIHNRKIVVEIDEER